MHGEGHGGGLEGALFGILQALSDLWPSFRSKLPQGDLGPLWHEFRARNVYQEASNVSIFLCDSTAKIIMVQEVEWVKCA